MAIERLAWIRTSAWPALNAWMQRAIDVLTGSDRWATIAVSSTSNLVVTWPLSLVGVNTSGGAVSLTLPRAADVSGFEIAIKRTAGASTLTMLAAVGDTIDGSGSLTSNAVRLISTGSSWIAV